MADASEASDRVLLVAAARVSSLSGVRRCRSSALDCDVAACMCARQLVVCHGRKGRDTAPPTHVKRVYVP